MPVFALYNLDDAGTVAVDSATGNGAQNGGYFNGAVSSGGRAVLDGENDLVKIFPDPAFQLDTGTLAIKFTLSTVPQDSTQTVLSRDSIGTNDGSYRIDIQENGAVVVSHETASGTTTFGTDAGFANPGETIDLSYSFDETGTGGQLVINNTTTGDTFSDDVPAGLGMNMGGQNQPWMIGAGQSLSNPGILNDLNQQFAGKVDTFSLSDTVDNIDDDGEGDNSAPVAENDTASTIATAPVVIDVLENDSDINGDPLTITGTSTTPNGTVVVNADNTLTFTANPGFTGDASFSYNVDDGNGGSATAFVTVSVGAAPPPPPPVRDGIVSGTPGDDLINLVYTGDPDGDRIDNNDALLTGDAPNDDRVVAGGGNDIVVAGAGDDSVEGGSGDDSLAGNTGDDSLFGGDGGDQMVGGGGNDSLTGGDGSDSARGGAGDDVIDTSAGGTPLPDLGYTGLYAADATPLDDLDTVYGGRGDDVIRTGDDADLIYGGFGQDSINGGIDNDTIFGNQDDDTIIGGEGSDSIDAGQGNDLVYGGLDPSFPDAVNIRDDQGDLVPNNGADMIRGGLGTDTIWGLDDDDTIYGGQDADVIDAGIDDDQVYGGSGNDTLTGGQGADTLFGNADRDVFIGGGVGDVVNGNENGDDFDTLDLTGSGPLSIVYDPDNAENGVVSFLDADRNVTGTMSFVNIENVIPCFTPGTMIATPRGEMPVEKLQPGDRVITRDNGLQEIRWIGSRSLSWRDLNAAPHLKPVLVRQGSLGNGLPERDMMVSPNHRLLVANDRTALYFDEHEVLVAAKHLIAGQGVHSVDSLGTTYIHFMFDRHEVVLSNGAWTESFQPGDMTLKGMGNAQRSEIFDLFPDLKTEAGLETYGAARRTLKRHEAVLLAR